MAVWWPSSGSSCRVDLLEATYAQVYASVRCQHPTWTSVNLADYATEIFEKALGLRAANDIVEKVGPGIVSIINVAKSYIKDDLPDVLAASINAARNLGLNAQAALRDDLLYQSKQSKSLIDQVVDGIGGYLNTAGSNLDNVVDNVTGGLSGLISGAGDAVRNVTTSVGNAVTGTINTVTATVGNVVNQARNSIASLASAATDFLSDALANIGGAIGGVVDFVGDNLGGLVNSVRNFIGDLIRNVQTGIGGIVDRLNDIPGAVINLGADIIAAFGGGAADFLEGIGKFLADPLEGIIGGFFHNEEPEFLRLADQLYDVLVNNPDSPAALRNTLVEAKQGGRPVPAIVAAVIIPVVLSGAISAVLMPLLQPAIQAENVHVRPTLLGLGDAVQAHYRGELTRDDVYAQGNRNGYSDKLIEAALALGRPQPNPIDLADWRHRGFIPDGVMVERLQQQGWDAGDATMILDASEVIPPISDLVRFAVREAFPGQTGYGGARGSGVPSRFIELAKQHGMDAEFARSYWAAHWELPSVTAAFAMYHRELIDEGQLRALLKEQDFAPEWIDRLIDVAYDPLTRVDVRRMRALGVLTPSQVEQAYRDLGYSAQNAKRLADFTEADIADSKRTETSSERDLTRADVVGAYADGVITRSQAASALSDLGYDNDETELILDREDIRQTRAERKETRTAIVDQVLAGVINIIGAQDKLNAAGYTTDEVAATVREIERKQAAQIKQPTKAELDRFRKASLLTDDEYRTELERLGYAPRWIDAFVALGSAQVEENG